MDPAAGGLFELTDFDAARQLCRTRKILALGRPTALAFSDDGTLWVTVLGDHREQNDGGKLLKITNLTSGKSSMKCEIPNGMAIIALALTGLLTAGCSNDPETRKTDPDSSLSKLSGDQLDLTRISAGSKLADRLCTQCHLRPQPADLPQDRWPFVIQWMGHYLGHDRFSGKDRSLIMPQFVPAMPRATEDELADIEFYFVNSSQPEISPEDVLPEFEPTTRLMPRPFFVNVPRNYLVSSIHLDETKRRMYLANGTGHRLLEYDLNGRQLAIHNTFGTQAVGIHSDASGFYTTLIGDLFDLKEAGAVMHGRWDTKKMMYQYSYPFRNYFRLAHVEYADVNGDQKLDFLASGFGSSGKGGF